VRGAPETARRVIGMLAAACAVVSAAACGTHGSGSADEPVTYYVSPSGSDTAAGTSPSQPWRTLQRATSAVLPPGSRLLLQGGQRFTGQLKLDSRDGGAPGNPVTIGSYGGGEATISAAAGPAVTIYDTAGVQVQDLRLVGQLARSQTAGINVFSDRPAGHREDHIVIHDVDVTGFMDGIMIGGQNPGAGFSHVDVSDSKLHGNLDAGLLTFGPTFNAQAPTYANQDVRVTRVTATDTPGDPSDRSHNSGNGIVLGSVREGSVTWSTSARNGGRGAAVQGPAGIWTYDSTGVDIAHCLAFGQKTADLVDGNGFGIDQNTSDSVLEDNLSYGNAGTGFLDYTSLNNGHQRDNTIRHNISSDDSRDGAGLYGGITVIGPVKNVAVDQNTVVMGDAPGTTAPALRLSPAIHDVTVRNNIFSAQSGLVVASKASLSASMALLQGNDYYGVAGDWRVVWGATTYTSLSTWRAATAQETAGGAATGTDASPEMTGPVVGLHVQSATDTSAGAAFALRAGSPLIGAGLDLASLGTVPAPSDYAGQPVPRQHPNVGAQ
jgi:hypothetical protein